MPRISLVHCDPLWGVTAWYQEPKLEESSHYHLLCLNLLRTHRIYSQSEPEEEDERILRRTLYYPADIGDDDEEEEEEGITYHLSLTLTSCRFNHSFDHILDVQITRELDYVNTDELGWFGGSHRGDRTTTIEGTIGIFRSHLPLLKQERALISGLQSSRPPGDNSVDYGTTAAKGLQTQMGRISGAARGGPAEGPAQPDAPEEAENGTNRRPHKTPPRGQGQSPQLPPPVQTLTTTYFGLHAQLQSKLTKEFTAALAARDTTRNGDDSHSSGVGIRRPGKLLVNAPTPGLPKMPTHELPRGQLREFVHGLTVSLRNGVLCQY
ncbi:hypothetical protein Tco_1001978 [Tanacetum coccineum]|uniref:Uncharacterized protein n=1 Tax=Tanacetum coccineum TaxID=301880 RepID=A0ABQ5F5F0_9ASTR